jgi:hypothetical protein
VNNLTVKTMGSLKKYIPVIIIVVPLILAVILRGTSTGHFRYDAERWASPSFNGANIITPGGLSQLKGNIMVLNFASDPVNPPVSKNQIAISPDSLLSKDIMRKIDRNKGAVVLWSDDPAIAARIWMVLSQTGIKDLYILSLSTSDETLKEKFRADTLISPEL